MIRVHVKTGLLGEAERFTAHVDYRGQTAADLVHPARSRLPGVELAVAVNGRKLEDLEERIPDGADVVIGPEIHGPAIGAAIVYAIVSAAISFAINYVVTLIVGKPKAPGVPQERGDEKSPTYAWDGVQTSYGQGFPVPYGYGRHDLGGQGIYTSVFASQGFTIPVTQVDRLSLILALCEGRIHKIGDQTGGTFGEANALGGFPPFGGGGNVPDTIRVNSVLLDPVASVPGARVWFRAGELAQSPPPSPFSGTNTVFSIAQPMNEAGASHIFLFSSTAEISQCQFTISFPGGLFETSFGVELPYPVTFRMQWRPEGAGAWNDFLDVNLQLPITGLVMGISFARIGVFTENLDAYFPSNTFGPVEVRTTRVTAAGGSTVSDQAIWRQVGIGTPHVFAYPRTAWLGLEIEATERLQGGLPQVRVRCDLTRVRVWDENINGGNPSSTRYWDLPAAGDPYDGLWQYPPGRNPAWILADFLTAPWGLGEWLTDANIDWPAFRRWAAFCDSNPGPGGDEWNEARFSCDFVGDSPRPAWEIVMLICNCGRATPVMRGDKISVVYQYRDAHADGSVSVPAKTPLQLFTSGNVEDLQVTWMPRANRPTVIQYQFLNEEQDYAQDVFPLEDFEAAIGDPTSLNPDAYRPEEEQAFGITRPSQLFREGKFTHRVRRLIEREVTFRTGPWALAVEPGDLFELEHDILRPFGQDVPVAMAVRVGGTTVTQITVDHAVSLPAGTLEVAVRNPDGEPERSTVSAVNPVTGGTELTLDSAVTVNAGSPCSVGLQDKITEVYEVVAVNLTRQVKREVRAIQWVPEVYDEVGASELTASPGGFLDQPGPQTGTVLGEDLVLQRQLDGSFRLAWTRPPARARARARVFIRREGLGAWLLVDETRETSVRVTAGPFERYEAVVLVESAAGQFGLPVEGLATTLTAPEFPEVSPPAVRGAVSYSLPDGLLHEWVPLDVPDLRYYELRAGRYWNSAAVLYRGQEPRFFSRNPRETHVLVAARSTSGLYSQVLAQPAVPAWTPAGSTLDGSPINEIDGDTPGGTFTDAEWTSSPVGLGDGVIRLEAGADEGTYESEVLDQGSEAARFWRVIHDHQELEDQVTVDNLAFPLNSGEARWRTVDGRSSSLALPGGDWTTRVDDLAVAVDDAPDDLRVSGWAGVAGSRTQLIVESRFYVGAVWGAYSKHVDSTRTAERMQVRITLRRESHAVQIHVPELQLEAYS